MATAPLSTLSRDELQELRSQQRGAHAELVAAGLTLDMTRGKPSPAQLDLSNALLSLPTGHRAADGTDVRNYGGLAGLAELREIFSPLLGVPVPQLVAAGNSSLTLMHDLVVQCLLVGAVGSPRPWVQEDRKSVV